MTKKEKEFKSNIFQVKLFQEYDKNQELRKSDILQEIKYFLK